MDFVRKKKVWIPGVLVLLLVVLMALPTPPPTEKTAQFDAAPANPATLMAEIKTQCNSVRKQLGDSAADTCWSRAQCIEKKVGVKEMIARGTKYQLARLDCK